MAFWKEVVHLRRLSYSRGRRKPAIFSGHFLCL
nr:MAG TPA: hypothetical protein [Caudoviricetes sp.]